MWLRLFFRNGDFVEVRLVVCVYVCLLEIVEAMALALSASMCISTGLNLPIEGTVASL